MKKFAIITPTYNEASNIPRLIKGLAKVCTSIPDSSFTLFVIDDSSPDGTARNAVQAGKQVKSKNFFVKVLTRKEKDGIDKAYLYGFQQVLKQDFEYIIQIDADLSHNPKYIKDFVRAANEGKDFVVASRYIKGGGVSDWGLHRRILSRGGNLYTMLFLSRRLTDYTGGFNMFTSDLLSKIDPDSLDTGGYGFFIELKYRALKQAQNLAQIPIIFSERQHGQSKLPKNTLITNLLLVPRLRFSGKK